MKRKKIKTKTLISLGITILIICYLFFCFQNYNKNLSGKATDTSFIDDFTDKLRKINSPELVKPALREPALFKDAICNDGTPFAFIIEKTNSNKWLIYLKGGGWCDDNSISCKERMNKKPELITTIKGEDGEIKTMPRTGIFSRDESVNLKFFDANFVYAYYCSSDCWTGSTTQPKDIKGIDEDWYFTGKLNVESMIKILKSQYGLDDNNPSTEVVIVGTSAGAIGVNANAETLSNELPNTANKKKLKIISDGAFLPNFSDPDYPAGDSNDSLNEMFIKAYNFWNSSLNSYCEEDQIEKGNSPGNCFMNSILNKYLTGCEKGLCLPLLIQTSSVDSFFLNFHHIKPENTQMQEKWRELMLKELGNENIFWLFSIGERYHALITKNSMWNTGQKNKGLTYGKIINLFLKKAHRHQKIIYIYDNI